MAHALSDLAQYLICSNVDHRANKLPWHPKPQKVVKKNKIEIENHKKCKMLAFLLVPGTTATRGVKVTQHGIIFYKRTHLNRGTPKSRSQMRSNGVAAKQNKKVTRLKQPFPAK